MPIEYMRQAPIEPPLEYIECIICEDSHIEEDVREIAEKNICIWCMGRVAEANGYIKFSKMFELWLKEWARERPFPFGEAMFVWADFRKWLEEKEK